MTSVPRSAQSERAEEFFGSRGSRDWEVRMRLRLLAPMAALAFTALLLPATDARACGGCFHPPIISQGESTVVTGHRMAFSTSPTQTVLWDQIKYSGDPKDFAWV